jgi:hypothetical protein
MPLDIANYSLAFWRPYRRALFFEQEYYTLLSGNLITAAGFPPKAGVVVVQGGIAQHDKLITDSVRLYRRRVTGRLKLRPGCRWDLDNVGLEQAGDGASAGVRAGQHGNRADSCRGRRR